MSPFKATQDIVSLLLEQELHLQHLEVEPAGSPVGSPQGNGCMSVKEPDIWKRVRS